jgi:hypothetical protein
MRGLIRLGVAAIAVAAPISQASAERVFGLTSSNNIVTFDSATPGTITSVGVIRGIDAGDTLIGLDQRPANRILYSLTSSGELYRIIKDTSGRDYTAVSLGNTAPAPSGSGFGFDFNPVVDRLRVVSDANQNLRIVPDTAQTFLDGAITRNGSSNVDIVGSAYRNSRPGATATVLYGLDAVTDSLVRATNANAGMYTNLNVAGNMFGPLGVSFSALDRVGFDISGGSNQGFFTVNDAFYTVDQITGAGAFVGNLGVGGITGIATGAVPEPASWALMIGGFGLVGSAMRRRQSAGAITTA